MSSSMSLPRVFRLCLLTSAFVLVCGLPDSLDVLIDVVRFIGSHP